MNIQFRVEHGETPERPADGEPQNIIIAGNFGGTRMRAAQGEKPDPGRNMLKIDLLDLDSAMASLSPIAIVEVGGQAVQLDFHSMDDLHPDRLYRSIPAFLMISELKQSLANPDTCAAAAEICKSLLGVEPTAEAADEPSPSRIVPDVARESEDDMFGRLLGQASHQKGGANPRVSEAMQRILSEVTAESVIPATSAETEELRSGLAEWATAAMRELLQTVEFREIEVAWRSLLWLSQQIETDEDCTIWIIDTGAESPAAWAPELQTMALRKINTADLLIVLHEFSDSPDSLAALRSVASAAESIGAKTIATSSPSLAGVNAEPNPLEPLDGSAILGNLSEDWRETRCHTASRSVALGFGEFLLRQPYGERSDPIDAFDFEEIGATPERTAFVWASAGVAIAAMYLQQNIQLDDLPMVVYDDGGGQAIMPVTGTYMAESASDKILANGLVPIVGHRGRTSLHVPRMQTIADPPGAF